jgi:Galactose oxidase, central domain
MPDMDPFEQRLATRLRVYAATAARPPSPEAVARAVAAARKPRMGFGRRRSRSTIRRGPRSWLLAAAVLALLLVAALASALAVGGWLRFMADERPSPSYAEKFQAVGLLPPDTRPQAMVAQPDGSALLAGRQQLLRLDPETGRFTQVGRLQIPRILPATVVLDDGRVLILGGGHDIDEADRPPDGYRAEIYGPASGRSTLTGSTVFPRAWGTATLLDDGRVLVTGGEAEGYAVATAELFDPRTGNFVETGSMTRPRSYHAAILLDDGRVLVIGGSGSSGPASAELYDPETGTFVSAGPMAVPQATDFSATRLVDGRVLILGGWDDRGDLLAGAQVYDPDTGRFTAAGSLPAPRQKHSAALLHDGRVLIVGGWDGSDGAIAEGDDAFIYDPATGAFTRTASLTVQRLAPFVVTLADGRVLVVGSQCWNPGCYGLDDLPSAADRALSAEVFK